MVPTPLSLSHDAMISEVDMLELRTHRVCGALIAIEVSAKFYSLKEQNLKKISQFRTPVPLTHQPRNCDEINE